jgi:hypothetical protein
MAGGQAGGWAGSLTIVTPMRWRVASCSCRIFASCLSIHCRPCSASTSLRQKNASFYEISLCLSRACLGKMIDGFDIRMASQKDAFVAPDRRLELGVVDVLLRENGTFFEFSLCSSRACLGQMLIFIYKWRKKCRFLAFLSFGNTSCTTKTHTPVCVSAFPVFVPSLSW